MTHRGRAVKWKAADGGWKTGHVVVDGSREVQTIIESGVFKYVQDIDGAFSFVKDSELVSNRDEWEGK